MLPLVSQASATKISFTSASVVPSKRPREMASVVPFSPRFGYERYTRRFSANRGCSVMNCRPLSVAGCGGASHTGCACRTPSRIIRKRPLRSLTRIVRASGNARLQGWNRPPATNVTLIR